MKLLEKILFATDFSDAAGNAAQVAIAVAKTFDSEIILMHVIPEFYSSALALKIAQHTVMQELERIQEDMISEGIESPPIILEAGSPFVHIIQQANFSDVNLIMLGSGEESRLGITAEKMMRKANKPVWVVKAGVQPSIKKILCPVDFSKPSHRALSNAIHLARRFQAKLTVMHVVQSLSGFYLNMAQKSAIGQETFAAEQQARFERFLQTFDFYNVHWNMLITQGKPDQEILNLARQLESDLLIMGTVGQNDHPRNLMGSVTQKVIRQLPCSIITVKTESVIQLHMDHEIADLEAHFQRGKELLENGLPTEAMREFHHCIDKDILFAPAWEGLAAALERLGLEEQAEPHRARAKEIRQKLWEQHTTPVA